MKQPLQTPILLGAVGLSLGLVGAGAFVFGGALGTFLILCGIFGIPMLLLGVLVFHYTQVFQRAGELSGAVASQLEVGVQRMERRLSDASALMRQAKLPPQDVDALLDSVSSALAPHLDVRSTNKGVSIVIKDKNNQGAWVRKAETRVTTVLREQAERTAPVLEAKLREISPNQAPKALPRDSLVDLCRAYLGAFETAGESMAKQIEEVEREIHKVEAEFDAEDAWENVRSAKRLWEANEAELAIRSLQDARTMVRQHLAPSFQNRQSDLLRDVGRVRSLEIATAIGPQFAEVLTRLDGDVSKRDLSSAGLASMDADEKRFAQVLNEIGDEARKRMGRVQENLKAHPGLADEHSVEDLASTLRALPTLQHPYQDGFQDWVSSMQVALGRLGNYSGYLELIRWMPKMAPLIEKKLAQQGRVRAEDLPIRANERERGLQILQLYADAHKGSVRLVAGELLPLKEAEVSRQVPVARLDDEAVLRREQNG